MCDLKVIQGCTTSKLHGLTGKKPVCCQVFRHTGFLQPALKPRFNQSCLHLCLFPALLPACSRGSGKCKCAFLSV